MDFKIRLKSYNLIYFSYYFYKQTSREKIELLAAYLGKIVIANKEKHGRRKHE
jgi:hypothetical protein